MMMYNVDGNGIIHDIPQKTSKWTRVKHSNFEHFLDTMMDHWFKNNNGPFWLIDLNAGCGVYPSGLKTMGLRFIEKYLAHGCSPEQLTGIMCEPDIKSAYSLMIELDKRGVNHFEFLADNKFVMETPGNLSRGLILYDPNGIGDFDTVHSVLKLYPNTDVFMHLQPGFASRRFWDKDYFPMFKHIQNIDRHRVLVSPIYNKYVDCVAVNHMTGKLGWTSKFFVPQSKMGLSIFRHLSYKWKGKGCGLSIQRFIKRALEVHGAKYSYEKTVFRKLHGLVTITCPIHGDFRIWASNHLAGSGCPQCAYTHGWLNRRSGLKKVTLDEFIRRSNEIHNSFYQYDKIQHFQNTTSKVTITCPKHGDFQQTIASHLSGSGCLECALEYCAKKRTLTTDTFIKRAKEKFGDKLSYEKSVYKNAKTKITVTCPIHGDFKQLPGHHLKGTGCPKCTKYAEALTQEEFIRRVKSVYGDKYTYEKTIYKGVANPVTITCKIHGDFTPNANNFLHGHGCMKCAHGSRTTEDFIREAKVVHGDKYSYDRTNYTSGSCKVIIGCPIHGDFEQNVQAHLKGGGCKMCGSKQAGDKHRLTQDQFLERSRNIHGSKYDYSQVQFTGTKYKVKIICPIHGTFEQTASSHLKGLGCKKCGNATAAEKKRKKKNPKN